MNEDCLELSRTGPDAVLIQLVTHDKRTEGEHKNDKLFQTRTGTNPHKVLDQ